MASPATMIGLILRFYSTTIFVYVLLSWFVRDTTGPLATIYRTLAVVCEPYVGLFRRILPTAFVGAAGLDFSPLVALLVLAVIERAVYTLL